MASADELAQAIVRLDAWKRVGNAHWALVTKRLEVPLPCSVVIEGKGNPVRARLMVFAGFEPFAEFQLARHSSELGIAAGLLDIRHWEVMALRNGKALVQGFRPGYSPAPLSRDEAEVLGPALGESLGVMLRLDSEPGLLGKWLGEGRLFSRTEGLDGKWRDAPLAIPAYQPQVERIQLPVARCRQAASLPVFPSQEWQVDFFTLPMFRTDDPAPRIMYAFGGVDGATGEWIFRGKYSVEAPKVPYGVADSGAAALRRLWEALSSQLLEVMLAARRVPGTVSVRSARMMRFLRPLGLQLPFKLVEHRELKALDAAMNKVLAEGKV